MGKSLELLQWNLSRQSSLISKNFKEKAGRMNERNLLYHMGNSLQKIGWHGTDDKIQKQNSLVIERKRFSPDPSWIRVFNAEIRSRNSARFTYFSRLKGITEILRRISPSRLRFIYWIPWRRGKSKLRAWPLRWRLITLQRVGKKHYPALPRRTQSERGFYMIFLQQSFTRAVLLVKAKTYVSSVNERAL